MLPDLEVLDITLLELHQLMADNFLQSRVILLQRIDLAVKSDEFINRSLIQRLAVEQVLPAVDHLPELGAPVADMVVSNDVVTEMTGDSGKGVPQDRAADVAYMHRLGNIRRAEINDNGLRLLQ